MRDAHRQVSSLYKPCLCKSARSRLCALPAPRPARTRVPPAHRCSLLGPGRYRDHHRCVRSAGIRHRRRRRGRVDGSPGWLEMGKDEQERDVGKVFPPGGCGGSCQAWEIRDKQGENVPPPSGNKQRPKHGCEVLELGLGQRGCFPWAREAPGRIQQFGGSNPKGAR